jgi:ribonuclease P protein component
MKSLKDKNIISNLFISGRKIYTPTINAKFLPGEPEVMVSVPIRLFKRAVDRNAIKRMIREATRTKVNPGLSIALVYNSDKIEDFKTIESDINKIFNGFK